MVDDLSSKTSKLFGELEDKMRILNDWARGRLENGDHEGVIQIRAHQFALSRILVNVHNRPAFLLVEAHTKLSEAYLASDYIDQACDHIKSALRLNGNLFNVQAESKPHQVYLLTLLGKCYSSTGSLDEALALLEKALKMSQNLLGEGHADQAPIMIELGKVYLKFKEFDKALDILTSVWEIYEAVHGKNHEVMVEVYKNLAEVYKLKKDLKNSADMMSRMFGLMCNCAFALDETVKCGVKLVHLMRKDERLAEAMQVLVKCEGLLEGVHGNVNKRTAKVKRIKCVVLTQGGKYEEALAECFEVLEIDKGIFGIDSSYYAKDLKIIGSIMAMLGRNQDGIKYLASSLEVYVKLKNKKVVREIKTKIESLKQEA